VLCGSGRLRLPRPVFAPLGFPTAHEGLVTGREPEELQEQQRFALDQAEGPVRLPLDRPLRTTVHAEGLPRRVEIVLAFVGVSGRLCEMDPWVT
jgi:hypothetical protein